MSMVLGINNIYRQKPVKPENTKIMIIKQLHGTTGYKYMKYSSYGFVESASLAH